MSKLFNFISLNKNKYRNTFINSAFKIGEEFNLENKDIAIISIIYFTKNFIAELESISQKDDIIINKYKEDANLNEQEMIVLDYIINQNKKEKEASPNKIIEEKGNNNNLAQDNNEEEKELTSTFEDQSDNNNNFLNNQSFNEEESKKRQENDTEEDVNNKIFNHQSNRIEIEPEGKMNKEMSNDKGKENDKYSLLLNEINQMKTTIYQMNTTIYDLKKKIYEHEEKIEVLTNIHRKIYFRDMSKYYIIEFAKKYLKFDKPKAYDSSL